MSDGGPAFLVNAYSDPVIVRIQGRASFLNAAPLSDFFRSMIAQDRHHFIVDFRDCAGMDSTFMGILAGAGIALRRLQPPGRMVLVRLGARNRELVCNLGLDRLMQIETGTEGDSVGEVSGKEEVLKGDPRVLSERERARLVLDAHENLVRADASNEAKFQDVLAFLRNQAEG